MDKNQAIGFVLIAALLMVWFYFFAPKVPEQTQQGGVDTTSIITAPPQQIQQNNSLGEKTDIQAIQDKDEIDSADIINDAFGIFTPLMMGQKKSITLENDVINVSFSNKGGVVQKVELKNYDDYQYNKPLVILDEGSSALRYLINTVHGSIDLTELYYTDSKRNIGDTTELAFRADLGNNKTIQHTYRLHPKSYSVTHHFLISGLENEISGGKVSMLWDNNLKRTETDVEYNRRYTTINYYTSTGSLEDLSPTSNEKEEATIEEPIEWFAFKQNFFTTGYVFNRQVTSGYFSIESEESDTLTSKYCKVMIDLPLNSFAADAGINKYYFGPNRLNMLKKVAPGFKENLYLGWPVVKWINEYVIITIFTFLEKYIGSYGIIIVILVFIIKLILSPLTYKSHIQMAKTKALKPELDELKAKYGDDMQKMQSEQMKLYQQVGVNPLSGCIPMLLQMPILFAMFQFIPHAIELRHQSFLWATDLSTYDSIISWNFDIPLISSFYGNHVSLFTLLMTISTILYTWINSQSTAQMQGPMKSMQYFMPIIFMFVLNKFPAGLTFYYFVSNLVSFGQIALIRRFVDDTKIRAILEENKKKNVNKKKSKFQARLEDAMKASEEAKKKKVRR